MVPNTAWELDGMSVVQLMVADVAAIERIGARVLRISQPAVSELKLILG